MTNKELKKKIEELLKLAKFYDDSDIDVKNFYIFAVMDLIKEVALGIIPKELTNSENDIVEARILKRGYLMGLDKMKDNLDKLFK